MTPAELVNLLQQFYRETSQLVLERMARARSVTAYDANNAYQQVIGRQDVHLRWVADAIADLGGAVPNTAAADEKVSPPPKDTTLKSIIESDASAQAAFIDAWSPRLSDVTNARHRKMLQLIVGEMAEHARAFGLAVEGRTDVLGRHSDGKVLRGVVLPTRPRD